MRGGAKHSPHLRTHTWTNGHVDTWTLGHLDKTVKHLDNCTRARTPEIHQKSLKNNVVENGPEHLGMFVKALGATRDDI